MEAPTIVKLEQEIEREMRIDAGEVESDYSDYEEPEPEPQKVAIDFKSLDEMVIMIFADSPDEECAGRFLMGIGELSVRSLLTHYF